MAADNSYPGNIFIPVKAENRSVVNHIMIRNDRTFFTNFAFITIGFFEIDDEEKVVSI